MIEEINLETYLYISKNEFKIFVFDKKKLKNLYKNELKIYDEFNFQDLKDLVKFLDENIYEIEKILGNFVKNITLIIERNENLSIDICLKKKNYDEFINKKNLENILIEAKDLFKTNFQEYTIMHMVINNYLINGKKHLSLIKDLRCDDLCLDINFTSISNELTYSLEKILEKYQIKISQYLNGSYIKSFFKENETELSEMIYKIRNGHNDNEVILISKNKENKGFFEKFFQLFS